MPTVEPTWQPGDTTTHIPLPKGLPVLSPEAQELYRTIAQHSARQYTRRIPAEAPLEPQSPSTPEQERALQQLEQHGFLEREHRSSGEHWTLRDRHR